MFINLNPHQIGLGQADFRELVRLAAKHGFEGIDLPAGQIENVHETRELAAMISDSGLRWGLFPLPCDFLRVADEVFETGLKQLERMLPLVEAAGCHRAYNHVWPGSDQLAYDENFAWHVTRLKRLCNVCGEAGVHLGIEFIGPKTLQDTFRHPFMRTVEEAVKLADAVGPELGIVVDSFHLYTSGGTADALSPLLTGERVVNVHVNDAQAGRARDEQKDLERAMPLATGLVDAPGVLRTLDSLGYDGPVIAEPFNPAMARFGKMDPNDVLREVGKCMHSLFEASGVQAG